MSTTTSAPLASTSSLPQSSPPRLTASPSPQSSPTIHVHYASRHVKARIDPGVPLPEIIRQLVSSSQLSISEPSTLFCLRIKETGQLLTPSNFHSLLTREVGKKNVLILGSSPEIEAIETLDKLSPTSSLPTLKLATFSLKTLIKDKEFRGEFLERRNGWETLMDVVERSSGNTLAYALNVVRDVLELKDQEGGGKRKCEKEFVKRIVEIVATQPLLNISRPATQILLLLLTSSPTGFTQIHPNIVPSSTSTNSSTWNLLPHLISHLPGSGNTTKTVVGGDQEAIELSLEIITALLKGFTRYSAEGLEQGKERKEESSMTLETFRDQELASLGFYQILTNLSYEQSKPFLLAYRASLSHSHSTLFSSERDSGMFEELWQASGLSEIANERRWRRIGFITERPEEECEARGREELNMFLNWIKGERERGVWEKLLERNENCPEEKRIRFPFVSFNITHLLSHHFLLTPSSTATEEIEPLIFEMGELHRVLIKFWMRLWRESDSTHSSSLSLGGSEQVEEEGDFGKIGEMVREKFQELMQEKSLRTMREIEKELGSLSYKVLRQEQIAKFEMRDELLEKPSIKRLRSKIYSECFSFVRSQRLSALSQGIWVSLPPSSSTTTSSSVPIQQQSQSRNSRFGHSRTKSQTLPQTRGDTKEERWRFVRLGEGRRGIEWIEFGSGREREEYERIGGTGARKGAFEELAERAVERGKIEIASITHLTTSSSNSKTPSIPPSAPSNGPSSRLSTLLSTARSPPPPPSPNPSLLTLHFSSSSSLSLQPSNPESYAELHDSLLFLLDPSSPQIEGLTQETLRYVETLTDVGLRVKLLDLTGDGIELLDETEDGEGRESGMVASVPDEREGFFYREYI